MQYIGRHAVFVPRMADAQTYAHVIRPQMLMDRPQAIVPGMPATGFQPHFAGLKIKFIVKDRDITGFKFEEFDSRADGLTGQVHEGFGFQQHHPFHAQSAFGKLALKF